MRGTNVNAASTAKGREHNKLDLKLKIQQSKNAA
jgi:hypothetical protein